MLAPRTPLWTPAPDAIERAAVTRFARAHGLPGDYRSLHRWSVEHLEAFWGAIWSAYGVGDAPGRVLGARGMPGAEWFPDATLNYAEFLLRGKPADRVAIRFAAESGRSGTWTWSRLAAETARVATALRARGVGRGDRVAAMLSNRPETVAALLAVAGLGAIWSCTAPEFGAASALDRFGQIEPKVLLAVDAYRYGGRTFDCTAKVAEIAAALPSCTLVRLDESGWDERDVPPTGNPLTFATVPFAHPLWVLYSSGTTGKPKAIVHSHGGILLEQLKTTHLQLDVTASDRVFWFTTTGWMMWNFLVGVLVGDAPIVLYDGSPAGEALWNLAEEAGITVFGTSAAFISAAMKIGIDPRGSGRHLASLRAVGSTGSPLAPEGFKWLHEHLGSDVWLFSMSGGTDVCTAFVGGVPTEPVYAGELQGPALGAAVEAWDDNGVPLTGEVGELVLTQPLPSMPVALWDDPDGSRLREAYFSRYPGVWHHGDWIELTEHGTAIISGRSDATINRDGVRIGTSEIYRVVLADPAVADAVVVDVPRPGERSRVPLFVVLADGAELDEELRARLLRRIREDCSPRHVPDGVWAVPQVPRTISGKILEVPIKRILSGEPIDRVVSRGSLADPAALDWFARWNGMVLTDA